MMTQTPVNPSRYEGLWRGRRTLSLIAPLVQFGFLALGFGIFLDQCRGLVSDAQFTWGERGVMGGVALMALGGCGFAGWIAGRLIKVAADVIDVMANGAEATLRTNELIERHVVPALARIAAALERDEPARDVSHPPSHDRNR